MQCSQNSRTGLRSCHGDFHGGNILFDGEKYIIIDWAEVACGAPAGDACRTYMDYYMGNREIAEAYLKNTAPHRDSPARRSWPGFR